MVRHPETAVAWTPFTRRLIDENRWRAKRSGLEAEFLTLDGQPPMACRTVVLALLDDIAEDAARLGCEPALARIRRLLDEGTSAHFQIKLFEQRRALGDSVTQAMQYVVDWLVAATYAGTDNGALPP
jgi:carboxylate-amine ligase